MNAAGKLLAAMRGSMTTLAMTVNTILSAAVIYLLTVVRMLMPTRDSRNAVRRMLAGIAENWIAINSAVLGRFRSTHWECRLPEGLDPNASYVVNCNHQSWVDILVLQRCFNRRAPFLRFFIKQQLIWVPFLGLAWWALDFPFMRRYSKQQLVKDPSLRGRDLDSAREACEKLADLPVSMMNFMEGTRFSEAKHTSQKSPYRNLLKPRIGGVGQVFYSLNHGLRSVIDVTIVYPDGRPTFWELVSGQVSRIVVLAREVEIPEQLLGVNFRADKELRDELEAWVTRLWEDKDRLIDAVLAGRIPDQAEPDLAAA